MSSIQGLGALAGGFSRGLGQGVGLASDIEDQKFRRGQRERMAKQQDREDADREALDFANKQALDFYNNARGARQAPGLTLDEGGMAPLTGLASAQQQPQMSEEDAVYGAFQARTNALAERGATKPWMESWKATADMRQVLRQRKYNEAEAEFRQTKDPLVFARKVYPYIDDGYDFVDGRQEKGLDGSSRVTIVRRNKATGQDETMAMTPDDLMASVRFAIDPAGVRKMEAQYALEAFKNAQLTKREDAKAEAQKERDLEVENARQKGRLELEEKRTAGDVKVATIRAKGGGGGGGEGDERIQSTKTDSDGFLVGVFRNGKTRRLEDEGGKPIRAESMAKRIDTLAANLSKNHSKYRRMPAEEVRKVAEGMLLNGDEAPPAASSSPAAAPSLSKLPANAKQIGTSGGKPVYQTPDGKRYIGD